MEKPAVNEPISLPISDASVAGNVKTPTDADESIIVENRQSEENEVDPLDLYMSNLQSEVSCRIKK